MKPILIVVDMQNDFVDGSLGTSEAQAIVDDVAERIKRAQSNGERIIYTLDTHYDNYLNTYEGRHLPIKHCIQGSEGHRLVPKVLELIRPGDHIVEKPGFAYQALADALVEIADTLNYPEGKGMQIELCGLCTDICVVSNAILIKARLPEADISVRASLCAGTTPKKHLAALETMRSCQIQIV